MQHVYVCVLSCTVHVHAIKRVWCVSLAGVLSSVATGPGVRPVAGSCGSRLTPVVEITIETANTRDYYSHTFHLRQAAARRHNWCCDITLTLCNVSEVCRSTAKLGKG